MKRYYSTAKLSERISETPEGFLICEGVPITRAGDLVYSPSETPITAGEGHTVVSRTIEDIHDPDAIASFEGKPVTINHPDDFVTPENWKELAVGVVQNVRPGDGEDEDKLLADLLITDREAIQAVKSKRLREVSCGYEAEYVEVSPGRGRQEDIRGNHVALVAAGRCGSECAIFDHAPKKETTMKDMKQKLLGLFGKALDEAMPEEKPMQDQGPADVGAALAAIMERLGKIEAAMAPPADAESTAGEASAGEAAASEEAAKDQPATIEERMAALEAAIAKLIGIEQEEPEGGMMDACKDAETIARAEILAPGIAKTGDIKKRSLDAAMATEDGKAVIGKLLAGKAYDSADVDVLFIAASELMKDSRRKQFGQQVSLDSQAKGSEVMTPEKINEMNAARYGNK